MYKRPTMRVSLSLPFTTGSLSLLQQNIPIPVFRMEYVSIKNMLELFESPKFDFQQYRHSKFFQLVSPCGPPPLRYLLLSTSACPPLRINTLQKKYWLWLFLAATFRNESLVEVLKQLLPGDKPNTIRLSAAKWYGTQWNFDLQLCQKSLNFFNPQL